ncbi:MAG: hypothetical protein DMD79_26765, partial [Candidatus Rokuibacteriota bacterium]
VHDPPRPRRRRPAGSRPQPCPRPRREPASPHGLAGLPGARALSGLLGASHPRLLLSGGAPDPLARGAARRLPRRPAPHGPCRGRGPPLDVAP